MNKLRIGITTLLLLIVCLLGAAAAQAQATRTWVSGVGDDANPCSRTAPCKTFAGAISKTAAGGEISVLDPGGFGAVTITKAITINGEGTLAGVLAAATNGIIVNAGVNDVVVIKYLSINGTSGAQIGLNGIRYLAGKQVVVENCTISGFSQKGIDVNLAASGRLDVRNTSITTTGDGVTMSNSAGTMNGTLDHVRIQGTSNAGVNLLSGALTMSNSIVANNTNFGVIAQGGATITLERTVVAHNGTGVSTNNAAATVRLSNTTINNNTAGITITAGTVASFKNNSIAPGQGAPNTLLTQQ
ncbi:MAG: right-handed parallel beta-helix repeat-containing protein [Acidobacteria bacterium]|nr:right-handed parallel beta-helix repeat-containing protein [Acidobacteriota bacterium]